MGEPGIGEAVGPGAVHGVGDPGAAAEGLAAAAAAAPVVAAREEAGNEFQFTFNMRQKRAGFWTAGEAGARRISEAICNERATKPDVQKTGEFVPS
jgi:hypothetical protein